jgi:hypothetical protein
VGISVDSTVGSAVGSAEGIIVGEVEGFGVKNTPHIQLHTQIVFSHSFVGLLAVIVGINEQQIFCLNKPNKKNIQN